MLRHRLLALGAVTVLALGVAGPAAVADTTPTTPPPTVSQSANTFTVNLPGVGSLSFMVDPATGAVSNLVATADPGFTAGTAAVTDEGVQVTFTAPDATTQVLKVEVEREDGAIKVTAESDGDQPDGEDQASASATPTTEHDGDVSEHQGATTSTTELEHEGETSTTTANAEHEGETSTTSPTSTTKDGHDGSGDSSSSTTSSSGGGD
jgi:hypothetical protein